MKEKTKIHKCKYHKPSIGKDGKIEHRCIINGWDNVKTCDDMMCDKCNDFKSKYIEYPITVSNIENKPIEQYGISAEIGQLVAIRPCDKEYQNKTYIGFYLGEMPIQIITSFNPDTQTLTNTTLSNPAIFVPELKKTIYGCESWWKVIESEKDFKEITDTDINNTWYVSLLKDLSLKEEK